MSLEYEMYLKKHCEAVRNCVMWFVQRMDPKTIDDILPNVEINTVLNNVVNHDRSKYDIEEYDAYDNYFYRDGKNSPDGKMEFDLAFLHHIHNNPHHWQHWVLIDDEGDSDLDGHQVKAMDMPDNYILEMIADWWSFSYNKYLEAIYNNSKDGESEADEEIYNNLYGIFDWYESHRDSIIFSMLTRNKVERFLDILKHYLDQDRPMRIPPLDESYPFTL